MTASFNGHNQWPGAPHGLGQLGPDPVYSAPARHGVADVAPDVPVRTQPEDTPLGGGGTAGYGGSLGTEGAPGTEAQAEE